MNLSPIPFLLFERKAQICPEKLREFEFIYYYNDTSSQKT